MIAQKDPSIATNSIVITDGSGLKPKENYNLVNR